MDPRRGRRRLLVSAAKGTYRLPTAAVDMTGPAEVEIVNEVEVQARQVD